MFVGNPVMDWHPIQGDGGVEILLVASCYRNWNECWPDGLLGTLCRLDLHRLSCHLQNDSTGGIYFHTNSSQKDSFCHRCKSNLGIRLFIHELAAQGAFDLTFDAFKETFSVETNFLQYQSVVSAVSKMKPICAYTQAVTNT